MKPIKNFAILGERCSGTNILERVIKNSFGLGITSEFSWKHWMQPENYTDKDKTDEVLFIGIVRDPIQWFGSFYNTPWHVPYDMRNNWTLFLTSEWYSIYDEGAKSKIMEFKSEIMEDRHPHTKERFKNIFELRQVKGRFLLEEMPKLVKHYIFIHYEDLLNDLSNTLTKISNLSGLPILKDSQSLVRNANEHHIPEEIMSIIHKNIDVPTEEALGYQIKFNA